MQYDIACVQRVGLACVSVAFLITSEEDDEEREWWLDVGNVIPAANPITVWDEVAARMSRLAAAERPAAEAAHICSAKTLLRYVYALAKASSDLQFGILTKSLAYVRSITAGGRFRHLLFCLHVHFDESPMKMKLSFDSDPNADMQTGKIVVVQLRWAMVMRDLRDAVLNPITDGLVSCKQEYLMLHGSVSAQLRATDRGTGEALAAVLAHCLPDTGDVAAPTCVHFFECDSLAANTRAMHLLRRKNT
eukprot:6491418-Amphidinium_carterae.1